MYRWHLADPIAWQKEGRITIQQIAYKKGLGRDPGRLVLRDFWYEPAPSAALPPHARPQGPHRRHLDRPGAQEMIDAREHEQVAVAGIDVQQHIVVQIDNARVA